MVAYYFTCTLFLGDGVYVDDVEFGTFLRAWRQCKHLNASYRISVFVSFSSFGIFRHYILSCDDPSYKLYGYHLIID